MALRWTKTALCTVDEIAEFIAKDNPNRATRFVLELKEAVNKLQVHPGMGRAGRVPGTRELILHENYIAIYRVRGDAVGILRLQHVARKLDRQAMPESWGKAEKKRTCRALMAGQSVLSQ